MVTIVCIPLFWADGRKRAETQIDASDAPAVEALRWVVGPRGYAYTYQGGRNISLHRFLMGLRPGDGLEVDHINGDKLDNRRCNLRVGTRALNQQNRGPRRGSHTSRYRGVYWDKKRGKWHAQAVVGRRCHFLGRFDDEDAAGEAASTFRRQHMPFTNESRAVRS